MKQIVRMRLSAVPGMGYLSSSRNSDRPQLTGSLSLLSASKERSLIMTGDNRAAILPARNSRLDVVAMDTPTPGPGEILVRNYAVAIQPLDGQDVTGRL
jgi:hypothetical protein